MPDLFDLNFSTICLVSSEFSFDSNSDSDKFSIAKSPLARVSPWLLWLPKMMSVESRARACPTAAASCPIDKWAGPAYLKGVS